MTCVAVTAVLASASIAQAAQAGAWRDARLRQRMAANQPAALPAGIRVVRDVAYGSDQARQLSALPVVINR